MAWNQRRYEDVKQKCQNDIDCNRKESYQYMMEYKKMVKEEDYEACKAITEVLKPLKYDTADTHKHIWELNQKK